MSDENVEVPDDKGDETAAPDNVTELPKRKRPKSLPKSMSPNDLRLFFKNPRTRKDVDDIKESLMENDQYKPVVVNVGTYTGRPNEVLVGNHTLMAVRELLEEHGSQSQWKNMLVHWVDVNDVRAAKIVAVDNKSADKGKYDDTVLADLLGDVVSEDDLVGTGYTTDDLEKLLGTNIIDGDADTDDSPVVYGVVVDCDSEQQQIALLEALEAEGHKVRALM